MPEPADWHLDGFPARIMEWAGETNPHPVVLQRVADWYPTIALDPFHEAFAEPGGGGERWLRQVPDAVDRGLTVVCSYSIDREARVVRCDYVGWRDDPPDAGHLH